MPGRNFLFIPGPTNVPQRVRNAMSIEQEDMRAAGFPDFTLPLFEDEFHAVMPARRREGF